MEMCQAPEGRTICPCLSAVACGHFAVSLNLLRSVPSFFEQAYLSRFGRADVSCLVTLSDSFQASAPIQMYAIVLLWWMTHRGRNRSISFQNATKMPPGSPRASKFHEFFIELEYVEFICDHPLKKESEAKNHKKWKKIRKGYQKTLIFI